MKKVEIDWGAIGAGVSMVFLIGLIVWAIANSTNEGRREEDLKQAKELTAMQIYGECQELRGYVRAMKQAGVYPSEGAK